MAIEIIVGKMEQENVPEWKANLFANPDSTSLKENFSFRDVFDSQGLKH